MAVFEYKGFDAGGKGISGIVDAGGLVLEQTPSFEPAALAAEDPAARPGSTVYTALGDWIVWASTAFLIAIGGSGVVRARRRARQGDSGRASGSARESDTAAEASLTSPRSESGSSS